MVWDDDDCEFSIHKKKYIFCYFCVFLLLLLSENEKIFVQDEILAFITIQLVHTQYLYIIFHNPKKRIESNGKKELTSFFFLFLFQHTRSPVFFCVNFLFFFFLVSQLQRTRKLFCESESPQILLTHQVPYIIM